MEKALKNTIIAKKYGLSLKSFFKDYFKYGGDDIYLIPFDHIQHFRKYICDYIKSTSHGCFSTTTRSIDLFRKIIFFKI